MKAKFRKILCTLGPASMNDRVISRLTDIGVNLFRINLSHTKVKDLENVIDFIQARTNVPICLDTEGAQVRTGDFEDLQVVLQENNLVEIPRAEVSGNSEAFNLYPLDTVDKIEVGDIISIDFNSVLVKVVEKEDKGLKVKVLTGGPMGRNKAVTVDREIVLPPLTEKDVASLAIGKKKGIKHVALSFANRLEDVEEIRSYVGEETYVISKIESISGVRNLGQIASRSDAILMDRGDMSRQVPIEQIPRVQKEIIKRTKQANIEMFVATNLLESMITVPNPTRAEVNDIFNTLVDGADGLVLAAETAVGKYPIECAIMVSKVIQQFFEFQHGATYFLENLDKPQSFFLVGPHGGELVDRCRLKIDQSVTDAYKKIEVDEKVLIDAEQIAIGAYSPLKGFMTEKELISVIEEYKLPSGEIWPLPVALQVDSKVATQLSIGQKVALVLKTDGQTYAILDIQDIYTYDVEQYAQKVCGVVDKNHPGVKAIMERPNCFLGGSIKVVKKLSSENRQFEITPRQARKIFEHKGWSHIIGFHADSIDQAVHKQVQEIAINEYHCDGILVHPLSGLKQGDDQEVSLKKYETAVGEYYPAQKVLLAGWQNYARYAGPREVVFTALCRKNFGCSHFLVESTDEDCLLFESLGDLGIKPIFLTRDLQKLESNKTLQS